MKCQESAAGLICVRGLELTQTPASCFVFVVVALAMRRSSFPLRLHSVRVRHRGQVRRGLGRDLPRPDPGAGARLRKPEHGRPVLHAAATVRHFRLAQLGCRPVRVRGWKESGRSNIGCTKRLRALSPQRFCARSDSHTDSIALHVWFLFSLPQESSSESINSYYALGLLGQALQDSAMESLGRALMTLEIQGTKSYWHSTKLETVYPEIYAENKWCVCELRCAGMRVAVERVAHAPSPGV